MADLTTSYLGLELRSPIIASCSPLTGREDSLLQLAENGAGAVVLPSLFQEEAEAEELAASDLMDIGDDFAEFASAPLPEIDFTDVGPARHVEWLRRAKELVQIPVIASVNGSKVGDWAKYARLMAEAGADAIELNLYSVNADPGESSAEVEARYLEIIESVRGRIEVPLAVKLSQHFTGLSAFARRADEAGADGLVLFNRFYGAEINLDSLALESRLALSSPEELRFVLRWIGILRAQRPGLSLAATSGVHSGLDALKALLVGANVACTASALLHNGPGHLKVMLHELDAWLDEHDYESVKQLQGSMSAANVPDPGQFERAQYMKVITSSL
ncbi:dihydroorotate dehydrogenase-like protein [Propionimicrobium sp. PCR01-08-3]|uniref:dihydroorotate dehydrogenase-like protein n=1 Tax=Propionimicrobium sp. PCR01-08-3 TaxID=3052086 RepID=UPI00255C4D90|nr:dihydroorotate dehydrogenase-like protein [Propionimicrobium sp. PCR01-08-3]WIY83298.1 dihydroorotate dehydrogenase-like protein [Propionimicrobium sp. PCR01-08-3]